MTISFLVDGAAIATLETELDLSFEVTSEIAAILEQELHTPVTVDTDDV